MSIIGFGISLNNICNIIQLKNKKYIKNNIELISNYESEDKLDFVNNINTVSVKETEGQKIDKVNKSYWNF